MKSPLLICLLAFSQHARAFTRVAAPSAGTLLEHTNKNVPHRKTPSEKRSIYYYCPLSTTLRASKSEEDDDVCTVQILMSDTGGGHRASANALRDAFDILYPGKFKCDIVDLFVEYGDSWPYNDYPALYKFAAKYSILWDLFFRFGCTEFGLWLNVVLQEFVCFDSFRECLNRPSCGTSKRADMIVSVHPLCQDIPLKALADLDSQGTTRDPKARTTPFATVVTDLGGAHPTWFNSGVDKCFVPSDALNQAARDRKLTPDQIVQYGLPIRKGFWSVESLPKDKAPKQNTKPKPELRQDLGLDSDLPVVLCVGGGDGMGGIVKIATKLGKKLGSSSGSSPAYQMVVVCGSNEAAKNELSEVDFGPGVKATIQGFVNNMDEWMKASDALVTKAGPGTIAEASICGLPCMLFAYLPGQEAGNVPYVENNGFGKYSGDPDTIADTVTSWLASKDTLEAMQKAALQASRPKATLDIAKDLAEIAFAQKGMSTKDVVRVRARR